MNRWAFLPAAFLLVLFLTYPLYQELGEIADRKQAQEEFRTTQRGGSPAGGLPTPQAWKELPPDLRSGLKSIGFHPAGLPPAQRGFTLQDLDESPHRLAQYRGNWVLINFWATWCPPCRMEMPSLEELWQQYRNRDFVLLAVDLQEQPYRVRDFVKEYDLTFPVLLDREGTVGTQYRVTGVPETWLITPQGVPVARKMGPHRWNSDRTMNLFRALLEADSSRSTDR